VFSSKCVALTTFDVAPPDGDRRCADGAELRRRFKLAHDCKIVLLSIGKDNRLERYWQLSESRRLPEYLAQLQIEHITVPNFSFPLDVPRTEHFVNRMRSLRSAERLSRAGLSVIPHLNGYNRRDWELWRDFLKEHSHITAVAMEFQTGLVKKKKALWHVWQLLKIEQSLGRKLHLVAVGGRRHIPILASFGLLTVVDSVPFVRAHKRRVLDFAGGKWFKRNTVPGETVDHLLRQNADAYEKLVEAVIRNWRDTGYDVFQRRMQPERVEVIPARLPDPAQLSFWPSLTMTA
jgi:hypothetical protein